MAILQYVIRKGGRANTPGKWANDRWDLIWVSPAVVTHVTLAPLFEVKFGVYAEHLPLPTDGNLMVRDVWMLRRHVWGIPNKARTFLTVQDGKPLPTPIPVTELYVLRGGDTLEFHH